MAQATIVESGAAAEAVSACVDRDERNDDEIEVQRRHVLEATVDRLGYAEYVANHSVAFVEGDEAHTTKSMIDDQWQMNRAMKRSRARDERGRIGLTSIGEVCGNPQVRTEK